MITKILGGLYLGGEAAAVCGCLCECYPEPRTGDYSHGYSDGTAQGANDVAQMNA